MLTIIGTDIVIRSFFTKAMHEGQANIPVSVPQQWFRKLLGILKTRLLGEVFEPKLSMFSKNYFPLPQSTYFVIAPTVYRYHFYFVYYLMHIHFPCSTLILQEVHRLAHLYIISLLIFPFGIILLRLVSQIVSH